MSTLPEILERARQQKADGFYQAAISGYWSAVGVASLETEPTALAVLRELADLYDEMGMTQEGADLKEVAGLLEGFQRLRRLVREASPDLPINQLVRRLLAP